MPCALYSYLLSGHLTVVNNILPTEEILSCNFRGSYVAKISLQRIQYMYTYTKNLYIQTPALAGLENLPNQIS